MQCSPSRRTPRSCNGRACSAYLPDVLQDLVMGAHAVITFPTYSEILQWGSMQCLPSWRTPKSWNGRACSAYLYDVLRDLVMGVHAVLTFPTYSEILQWAGMQCLPSRRTPRSWNERACSAYLPNVLRDPIKGETRLVCDNVQIFANSLSAERKKSLFKKWVSENGKQGSALLKKRW